MASYRGNVHHSPMDTSDSPVNRRRSCPPGLSPARSFSYPRHSRQDSILEDCALTQPIEPMQISPDVSRDWSAGADGGTVRAIGDLGSPLQSLTSAFLDLATSPRDLSQDQAQYQRSDSLPQPPPGRKRLSTPGRYSVIGNNNSYSPTLDTSNSRQGTEDRTPSSRNMLKMSRLPSSRIKTETIEHPEGSPTMSQNKICADELLEDSREETSDIVVADPTPKQGRRHCGKVIVHLLTFTVLIASIGYYTTMSQCTRSTAINMTELQAELQNRVFGQHIAVQQIAQGIDDFIKVESGDNFMPLVLSFHGWTGIGKNHVSNIMAAHMPDKCVERIIIPLHFPHYGAHYQNGARLRERILDGSSVTSCCLSLFIVDEVDKADEEMISGLKSAIRDLKSRSETSGEPSAIVMFLLSNTGGTAINRYLLQWILEGNSREAVTLSDVSAAVRSLPPDNNWLQGMLEEGLISHLVPFLPLEREHVRLCLQQYAGSIGQEAGEKHVEHALDSIGYFPEDSQLFSKSGCKKISSMFDLTQDLLEEA